jgi:hypothetical protein
MHIAHYHMNVMLSKQHHLPPFDPLLLVKLVSMYILQQYERGLEKKLSIVTNHYAFYHATNYH